MLLGWGVYAFVSFYFSLFADMGCGCLTWRAYAPIVGWGVALVGWIAFLATRRPSGEALLLVVVVAVGSCVPPIVGAQQRAEQSLCGSTPASRVSLSGLEGWKDCNSSVYDDEFFGTVPGTSGEASVVVARHPLTEMDRALSSLAPATREDSAALLDAIAAEIDELDWVYVSGKPIRDPSTGAAVLRNEVKVSHTTFHGIPARQIDRRKNFESDCSPYAGIACSYRIVVWIEETNAWDAYITYGTTNDEATIAKLRAFLSGPVFDAMTVRR